MRGFTNNTGETADEPSWLATDCDERQKFHTTVVLYSHKTMVHGNRTDRDYAKEDTRVVRKLNWRPSICCTRFPHVDLLMSSSAGFRLCGTVGLNRVSMGCFPSVDFCDHGEEFSLGGCFLTLSTSSLLECVCHCMKNCQFPCVSNSCVLGLFPDEHLRSESSIPVRSNFFSVHFAGTRSVLRRGPPDTMNR